MAPPALSAAKLDAAGLDYILEMVAAGRGLRYIGNELGVSAMAVSRWLNADALRSARFAEALIVAAEGFEDRAVAYLDEAANEIRAEPELANPIVTLARERAQAAWRQASVRDPRRYSDRRTSSDVSITIKRDVTMLPTAELEALVQQQRQTLELQHDGQVTGGASDSDDGGV